MLTVGKDGSVIEKLKKNTGKILGGSVAEVLSTGRESAGFDLEIFWVRPHDRPIKRMKQL